PLAAVGRLRVVGQEGRSSQGGSGRRQGRQRENQKSVKAEKIFKVAHVLPLARRSALTHRRARAYGNFRRKLPRPFSTQSGHYPEDGLGPLGVELGSNDAIHCFTMRSRSHSSALRCERATSAWAIAA